MSYFILGSTSFAGSSFVKYLLSHGEKVIGVSRSKEPHQIMQPYYDHPAYHDFKFFQCDINHDLNQIFDLIKIHKPRFLVDFAGQGMVAESWQNPESWYQTNIVAKVKLHHFLKDCDFIERYVRISTPEVYGSVDELICEDYPSNPSTPYAVSHAAIDMSLMAFYKQYQFPVILTRFANFYGPHQQLYRIIPRAMIYALLGKTLPLHGGGTSKRMFIYADDVSDGIYRTCRDGKVGEVYHFSNDPCLSIRELIEKICNLLNVPMSSFVVIAEERAGKDNQYAMNTTKAQKTLSWKPSYTLEQGLERTVKWVKDHIDIIQTLPLNYIHKI